MASGYEFFYRTICTLKLVITSDIAPSIISAMAVGDY